MIVKFTSTETGSLIMMSDLAGLLLRAVGKECTAEGVFRVEEMLPAVAQLRAAVARGTALQTGETAAHEEDEQVLPVSLHARAWPLIEMLERTAVKGPKAHILWRAAAHF